MSGWLYLIRNRDIYKIGITKNLSTRMRQLKPDNIVAALFTSDYIKLERELHSRYKDYRIPQTEYFRLHNSHLKEIKQIISKLDYNMVDNIKILIKSFLVLSMIFIILLFCLSLNINDTKIIFINSFLWIGRISYCISFLSFLVPSGRNFIFFNELKYRSVRLLIYFLFAILFRIAYIFLTSNFIIF